MNFDLFRYQILPLDRYSGARKIDLFEGEELSVEQTLARKNELVEKAIDTGKVFAGKRSGFNYKILSKVDDFYFLKINVARHVKLETKDFGRKDVDNWPSFYAAIWNHPRKQLLLIQENVKAVQKTQSAVNAIIESINLAVGKSNLKLFVEPLFEEADFWGFIEKHPSEILKVKFDLITPNMSNVSDSLSDDFKALAKDVNSTRTQVEFESDKTASLRVTKGNKAIDGFVKYASEGGGQASVLIKGARKATPIGTGKKVVTVDEIKITGMPAEEIASLLKELLE